MYISKGGGEFPFSSIKERYATRFHIFLFSFSVALSLDSRELWELQETYNRLTSLANNALKAEP
jgi:hypothetical protein